MSLLFSLMMLANYDEVTTYGVSNFGGQACGSSDLSHSVHTETAKKFRDPFYDQSDWDLIRWRENLEVRASLWTDGDADTSTWGIDSADVIYLHTHGSSNLTESSMMMGNDDEACNVSTKDHIRLGDGDLDIAVLKACQSADYDTWSSGSYWDLIVGGEFRMWNGFHGNSSCGAFVKWYVKDYSKHSFFEGVGENWLDEAYSGVGDDDCPVSIVWGDTPAIRETFYEHAGWLDRKVTGTKDGSTIFYIAGCSPDEASVLPE